MLSLTGCATQQSADIIAASKGAEVAVTASRKARAAAERETRATRKAAYAALTQPARCRSAERADVEEGERLDIALVKTNGALNRANAKAVACDDRLRQARAAFR